MTDADDLKRRAAAAAFGLVEHGMLLGLGTGSTAKHLIDLLGEALVAGSLEGIKAVPTSRASQRQAEALGIELVELPPEGVDLAIDGMDELAVVNGRLDAVKGLGGALLREKVVALAAKRFVLIGDDSKLVARLGERSPLPVEVARFGWRRTVRLLEDLGASVALRRHGGSPFVSDNGNLICDCTFEAGYDALALQDELARTVGVMEHGLFLGVAERAYLATADGVRELRAAAAPAARDATPNGTG